MIKKRWLILLIFSKFVIANESIKDENSLTKFQDFSNQIGLGFSANQTTMANGINNQVLQQSQYNSLDVEKLFNNGIWANLNASMMISTNSLGNKAVGTGMGYKFPASQDPFVGGFNAKVGYSKIYHIYQQDALFTPYLLIGRNTNLAMSTILANDQSNVTNDYFITSGLGIHVQYVANKLINIYFDQSWAYNFDQSQPINHILAQNIQVFNSTLGAKFNVWQQLQLGCNLFYNNYQYDQPAINTTSIQGGSDNNLLTVGVYRPVYNFGGGITVSMTY
jgi:hypothetical protein